MREVIDACRKVTGRDIPVVEKPRRPGDPPRLIAASSSAERLPTLPWSSSPPLPVIAVDRRPVTFGPMGHMIVVGANRRSRGREDGALRHREHRLDEARPVFAQVAYEVRRLGLKVRDEHVQPELRSLAGDELALTRRNRSRRSYCSHRLQREMRAAARVDSSPTADFV